MIPKIIHYVWLGGDDKSIKPYIKTWQKYNPSYELMRWDESNIDFSLPYLKTALRQKNYANISNLARLQVLKKYGGIYIDTDVRALKSFDTFLGNHCFLGFQLIKKNMDWVNNAVMGAEPNHWFINAAIDFLVNHFDGYEAANDSSPSMITKLLVKNGLRNYSKNGIKVRDIQIYPKEVFYPYSWRETLTPSKVKISSKTYAIHEWKKRWVWRPKPKLVMTLLVRDESDIVEQNIRFHLAHGVDHIIAMDNNSTDRTTKILRKYEKRGVLTYLPQPDNTYEQSKWVSSMAKLAVEKYGATHLIHADADEFWYPASGNLKDDLPTGNLVYYANSISYLPPCGLEKFIGYRWAVTNPIPYFAQMDRELSYRYLLYRYQPKIVTTNKFTNIIQGNHDVKSEIKYSKITTSNILIHHFPIRSLKHFIRKVNNGGEAYLHNPNQDPGIGWQWKEWYKLYQFGLIRAIYQSICLTSSERQILKYRGILKRMIVPRSITFAHYPKFFSNYRSKRI